MHTSCAKTDALQAVYPALFQREALLQEYELITKSKDVVKLAYARALEKCPRFLDLARSELSSITGKSKKSSKKEEQLNTMLARYDVACQHITDVDEQQLLRATVGLMILPILLGENSAYFISEYEVKIHFLHLMYIATARLFYNGKGALYVTAVLHAREGTVTASQMTFDSQDK